MANNTIYPFGVGGNLPANIGIINDKYTGGANKALSAEQGKEINAEMNAFQTIDLSDFTTENVYINNSTQKWVVATGYTGVFFPVSPGEKYVIQANASEVSNYAILTDRAFSNGGEPAFVDGGSRQNVSIGTFAEVTIPEDGNYIYICTHTNVDVTPQSVRKSGGIITKRNLDSALAYDLDLLSYNVLQAYPISNGKWMVNNSSYLYFGMFIPCRAHQTFILYPVSSGYAVNYTFLKTAEPVNNEDVDYASGYSGAPLSTGAGGGVVVAPGDATYLYIVTTYNGGNTSLKPSKITTYGEDVAEVVKAVAGESQENHIPVTLEIGEEEQIIYTRDNTIIKYGEESGVYYLYLSKDLGETWTAMENTHGNVTHAHLFLDGTILLCFLQYACYTKDFVTVEETTVYDYDGSVGIPSGCRFYMIPKPHGERFIVDGVEFDLFGDYILDTTTNPRLWYSNDNGRTIHAAFAFGLQQLNGSTIPARHIHDFDYDKSTGKFYAFTGDSSTEVHAMRGTFENGVFSWEKLKTGVAYKLTSLSFYDGYFVAVTDYTDESLADKKGIVRCPTADIDADNLDYLFHATAGFMGTAALSTYFADRHGWRVAGTDVNGGAKTLIAKGGFNFVWVDNSYIIKFMSFIGPNNNGDIYCQLSPVKNSGWSPSGNIPGAPEGESSLRLNRPSFNLTTAMRKGGAKDFLDYNIAEY